VSHHYYHLNETGGGYARWICETCTADQKAGLEAQVGELRAAGVEELFVEQVSSVQRREELEKALKFIRKGDTLLVTKLDRLARSIPDLVRARHWLWRKWPCRHACSGCGRKVV